MSCCSVIRRLFIIQDLSRRANYSRSSYLYYGLVWRRSANKKKILVSSKCPSQYYVVYVLGISKQVYCPISFA